MYIDSKQLTQSIETVAKKANIMSDHVLVYEEMVAIPCFGQIILRFSLNMETCTPDDLDRYESLLYGIAGDEFMTDLMGSVYRKAGADYAALDRRLLELNDRFESETLIPSAHADGIKADASALLSAAGLDTALPVWEIQADRGEYTLLLLGNESRKLATLETPVKLTVAEADGRMCTGLFKAAVYCKRHGISLIRVLADGR
ncbi:MAG: hypothetical protein K5663_11150 [Clostridiales bacterium]|nr:hypothetical protein [Clostridiales bacterium]